LIFHQIASPKRRVLVDSRASSSSIAAQARGEKRQWPIFRISSIAAISSS
jgi:hypothetical protein